jgi:hypothetical protein
MIIISSHLVNHSPRLRLALNININTNIANIDDGTGFFQSRNILLIRWGSANVNEMRRFYLRANSVRDDVFA